MGGKPNAEIDSKDIACFVWNCTLNVSIIRLRTKIMAYGCEGTRMIFRCVWEIKFRHQVVCKIRLLQQADFIENCLNVWITL